MINQAGEINLKNKARTRVTRNPTLAFFKSRARDSTTHSVRLSVLLSVRRSVTLSFFFVVLYDFMSF